MTCRTVFIVLLTCLAVSIDLHAHAATFGRGGLHLEVGQSNVTVFDNGDDDDDQGSADDELDEGSTSKRNPMENTMENNIKEDMSVFFKNFENIEAALKNEQKSPKATKKKKEYIKRYMPSFYNYLKKLKDGVNNGKVAEIFTSGKVRISKSEAEAETKLTKAEKYAKAYAGVQAIKKASTGFVTAFKGEKWWDMAEQMTSLVGTLITLCPHPACQGAGIMLELASTVIGLFNPHVTPTIDQKLAAIKNEIVATRREDDVTRYTKLISKLKAQWGHWSALEVTKMSFADWKHERSNAVNGVDRLNGKDDIETMIALITKWTADGFGKQAYALLRYLCLAHDLRNKIVLKALQMIPDPKEVPSMDSNYQKDRTDIIDGQKDYQDLTFKFFDEFLNKIDRSTIVTVNFFYPPGWSAESKLVLKATDSIISEKPTGVEVMDPLGPPATYPDGEYHIVSAYNGGSTKDSTADNGGWWDYRWYPIQETFTQGNSIMGKESTFLGREIQQTRLHTALGERYFLKMRKAAKAIYSDDPLQMPTKGKEIYQKLDFILKDYNGVEAHYARICHVYKGNYRGFSVSKYPLVYWNSVDENDPEKQKYKSGGYKLSNLYRVIRLAKSTLGNVDGPNKQPIVIGSAEGNAFLYNPPEHPVLGYNIKLKPMESGEIERFVWYTRPVGGKFPK